MLRTGCSWAAILKVRILTATWLDVGGCISLAVGLALPYDLGLIISQRGMLMKQTSLL